MDLDFDPAEINVAVLQEVWRKLAFTTKNLVDETEEVVVERESFREFSRHIAELSTLFETLQSRNVQSTTSSEATRTALQTLYSQLRAAHEIIKEYKSGSQLHLVLNACSVLKKMEEQSKEIADTLFSLDLANLDVALDIKTKTYQIIENMRSIEFRSAAATEAIASEIENTMLQNDRSRDHTLKLLHKIAEAVRANESTSLVEKELLLLKQEKEEMEAQKKQAEALQLSQLMQLRHRTEMVPQPEEIEGRIYQLNSIDSFKCPLCQELMMDPVAIDCGHSFERKAIQQHFSRGQRTCPTCKQELTTLTLTPNISLRGSIEEWLQREKEQKFQAAVSGIYSSDPDILSKSLENLQSILEFPRYKALVSQKGLIIPKMVEVLKANGSNTTAALKCLYHLSSYSDENKDAIEKAGAIRCVVKHLYKSEVEPEAVATLLELSTKETLVEQIGNARDCITLLVSLLHRNVPDVSQKAKRVLQNLSTNTQFVITMANAGYFEPFITKFNEAPSELRACMATALVNMQMCDSSIKNFEKKQFVHELVKMLSSSSPACKTACLNCIKKLLIYPNMVNWFLAETTIPLLIGHISSVSSEEICRKQATEVLISLIKEAQLSDFDTYPELQELQSQHNISLFLHLTTNSDPETRAQLLQLLLVLTQKSERARNLTRSDVHAVTKLFSFLSGDQTVVKRVALKVIYCISKDHPAGVPLPACPAKESAINAIVAILTSSPDIKERSTAAGIISHLPTDDSIVDDILHRSEALKAIQEVICTADDENCRTKMPINTSKTLLENALAALLRYTKPTKPELYRQVCKLELYPSLVRVLSMGSSLAKQRTAIALADLCQSSNLSRTDSNIGSKPTNFFPLLLLHRIFSNMSWCCSASAQQNMCEAHGSSCSSKQSLCLVKADAVRPLVQMLGDLQSGETEAALIALNTLLADQSALSHIITAIVDSQGIAAILEVLEKGSLPTKHKALDLFQRIVQHIDITNLEIQRSERILIHLLTEDALKRKAALVLNQMNLLPEQSSYF